MSDENKDNEEKVYTIPLIEADSIISIDVSGAFLSRLKEMFADIVDKRPEEDVQEMLKPFVENDGLLPRGHELYHLQTLTILIRSLETEFQKKGLIKEKTFTVDDFKNEG